MAGVIIVVLFLLGFTWFIIDFIMESKKEKQIEQDKKRQIEQEENEDRLRKEKELENNKKVLFKKASERFCPIMENYINTHIPPVIVQYRSGRKRDEYGEYSNYIEIKLIITKDVKIKYLCLYFEDINRVDDSIGRHVFKETGPFCVDRCWRDFNNYYGVSDYECKLFCIQRKLCDLRTYHLIDEGSYRFEYNIRYKNDFKASNLISITIVHWDNSEEVFVEKDVFYESIYNTIIKHPIPLRPDQVPGIGEEYITGLQAYLNGEEPQYFENYMKNKC